MKKMIKKIIPRQVFEALEPFGHKVEAMVAAQKNGMPGRKMHIIGVTGTNGKTTTCFMIHKMLTVAGIKSGLMTTVANGIGDDIVPQIAHMTTASAPILQKRLKEFYEAGVEWVVLETTSHALAQSRVWGIDYEIAVMTNITHEHLDYHKTFEKYVFAKRKLFEIAAKHGKKIGVINADDPSADLFASVVPNAVRYGINAGDLRAKNIELAPTHCAYTAMIGDENYTIRCNIPGEFNVYNSMAAIAVGRALGLDVSTIEKGIAALEGVEGRMTVIDEGQPFSVVVDFAHTPDSFERLLKDVRTATKGKLIVVFGSAGRRDEAKRAIQGEIAGKYGDEVVLTEEDDRDIDGYQILAQIAEGAEKSGKILDKDLFKVLDRTEAIRFAMTRAQTNDDCVILLGKGHEKTIERGTETFDWNEFEVAREAIHQLTLK